MYILASWMNPPREGASGVNLFAADAALLTHFALMQRLDMSTKGPEVVMENLICFTPEGL